MTQGERDETLIRGEKVQTLPWDACQVGQHVVKLLVCDLPKCREFWEHNDGAAIISSSS